MPEHFPTPNPRCESNYQVLLNLHKPLDVLSLPHAVPKTSQHLLCWHLSNLVFSLLPQDLCAHYSHYLELSSAGSLASSFLSK